MSLKIIGAGLERTGTMSLKIALEQLLEAPCYHMMEVFNRPQDIPVWHNAGNGGPTDWPELLDGFVAAVDWPASAFWFEISEAFPEAKILYSKRDPEKRWESASNTIFPGISVSTGPWKEMV